MATPLVVGDLVQARMWCDDSEQAAVNTVYYQVVTIGTSPATDDDLAISLDTAVNAYYKSIMNSNASYRGVQARIVNRIAQPALQQTNLNIGNGTAGSTALPRQVCGLIQWKTNFAGRAHQGRLYIPFPATVDDAGNGVPGTGYLNGLGNLEVAILGFVNVTQGTRSATVRLALAHRNTSPTHYTSDVIFAGTVSGRWATQRRRGSFGRANTSPV